MSYEFSPVVVVSISVRVMPTSTIRFEELQLLELATKSRVHGCKRAYLQKCDHKLKKVSQRWCCLFRNMLFYFESESSPKPVGVVFLEGTICRPVEQIGLPVMNMEVRKPLTQLATILRATACSKLRFSYSYMLLYIQLQKIHALVSLLQESPVITSFFL